MAVALTRQQLYDLVWSEPMQRLSAQIGISDVAIAKHCRRVGVPVPQRGYWNKLQAGKKVIRVALPPSELATINHIEMSGTLTPDLLARLNGEPGAPDNSGEPIELLEERFRKRLGKVGAPRGFDPAHPDVAKLLTKEEEHRQKKLAERYYWREPQFDTPFERRRLRLINGLFMAFARVGCKGWTRGDNARELSITIGDRGVGFTLDRPTTRFARTPSRGKDADRLCLTLSAHEPPPDVRLRWQDEDTLPLEQQMTDLVVGIAISAEKLHRAWIQRRIAWERQRREEEEREARRRREEADRKERERRAAIAKAKIDALLLDAENFRKAADLRNYIDVVTRSMEGQVTPDQLETWARWAEAAANDLDPLASGRAVASIRDMESPE